MDSLEALIKAKIPCEETGIRICHTVCAICSPANNCGVNAYVRDGRMVKLEGMDEHPQSKELRMTMIMEARCRSACKSGSSPARILMW